jgi:glycosyltransferase involved in cell wall biosynthesis
MAFVTPVLGRRKSIVTVYDLSFMHFPEHFPKIQQSYLATQTKRSCRQAARIVAISESGRQDIHKLFNIPLGKIDIVYPGIDPTFYRHSTLEIEHFKRKNKLTKPYILHVGTLQPRKNIPTLIKAFARLKQPDLELILVGGKGWLYKEIFDQAGGDDLSDRIRFTGYVDDTDLPLWYNGAEMLVLPSEYEGFGFPAAQAMACGTPVVASDASAIPEVTGSAALLFKPHDADTLADQMRAVLDDRQITATMRAQGLAQIQKFTWHNAGRDMVTIYKKVLAQG